MIPLQQSGTMTEFWLERQGADSRRNSIYRVAIIIIIIISGSSSSEETTKFIL